MNLDHVEIAQYDDAWWTLIGPDPPPDVDPEMVWDAWEPYSEPPDAWTVLGRCTSPRHAAQQAPAAAWDAFLVTSAARDEWDPDYLAAVIAQARPPTAFEPSGADPLETAAESLRPTARGIPSIVLHLSVRRALLRPSARTRAKHRPRRAPQLA